MLARFGLNDAQNFLKGHILFHSDAAAVFIFRRDTYYVSRKTFNLCFNLSQTGFELDSIPLSDMPGNRPDSDSKSGSLFHNDLN